LAADVAKILIVCSSGGHLDQALAMLPEPEHHEIVFATFLKPDALEKLAGRTAYGLHWPTNRSIRKAILNAGVAWKVMRRERPTVIISTGAAAAVPFFYLGKLLFRTRTVYVECIDRVDLATLTAKLVKPVTDLYVCQWPTQLPTMKRRVEVPRSR